MTCGYQGKIIEEIEEVTEPKLYICNECNKSFKSNKMLGFAGLLRCPDCYNKKLKYLKSK